MNHDPFKEYLKQAEPDKARLGYAWGTAIGLQAVDGLQPSQYLMDTALKNIEGEITISEAQRLINRYYNEQPKHETGERTEEADKVSARIAEILSENAFSFTPTEYISIHRKLFQGIYPFAGQLRDYNITKKEWVLDGASIVYGSASELRSTLAYDFSQEKAFDYRGLSMEATVSHLARFISGLWQIHAFGEGNTRTTAVFFIKYLRTLGFDAANDIFADHAWYFRNALVRANYTNLQAGVHETTEFLELFLRNLLLNEQNALLNRRLHISGQWNVQEPNIQNEKPNIEEAKPNIGFTDIVDAKLSSQTARTKAHAIRLYQFLSDRIFGRSMVMEVLGIKSVAASALLAKLHEAGIIVPVSGHGKGKYQFIDRS